MEMATQTKGKTKATATATATAKVQAAVKAATATGNGNLYTQNISTVKEHTYKRESRVCRKESAAAKPAEIQNNKTKIKISQHETKRNHLKFLINLYIKLTLCISQINKTTLKIFQRKTKLNINFSYTTTKRKAPQCIIELQQKLQEKAKSFIKFSFFKLKLLVDFLARFLYSKRKALRNYNKLTIRHFIGICLKRLISLKRLQQIPETHKQLDESLRKIYEKKNCLLITESLSLNRKKRMESLKALLRSRQRQIENIHNCKYYHTGVGYSCQEKLFVYDKSYVSFYKKCDQPVSQNPTEWQDQTVLREKLTSIKKMKVEIAADIKDFKFQQYFLKCCQPDLCINIVLRTIVDGQLQKNTSLNKTEFQKVTFHLLKKCGQPISRNPTKLQHQIFLKKKLTPIKEMKVKIASGIKDFKFQQNFLKCCQPDLCINIVLRTIVNGQLQKNISLNKTEIQNATFHSLKKCGQPISRNPTKLQHQTYLKKKLTPIKEMKVKIASGIKDLKLQQYCLKCCQLDLCISSANKLALTTTADGQLQSNISLNKTEFQKATFHLLKKCGQLVNLSNCIHLNKCQIEKLVAWGNEGENSTIYYIQKLICSHKYCQQEGNTIAVEYNRINKNNIEAFIRRQKEISYLAVIYQGQVKLLGLITDSYCKCGQLNNSRVVFEVDKQVKAYLLAKFQETLNKIYEKIKTSEQQTYSPNSPQKYAQLKNHKVPTKQHLNMQSTVGNNVKRNQKETKKICNNQIMILTVGNLRELKTNSPLKRGQLNKQTGLININIPRDHQMKHGLRFRMEYKTGMKLEYLTEFIKENLSSLLTHKFALIVFQNSPNIGTKNASNAQKKFKLLDILNNHTNFRICQHLLQNSVDFNDSSFQNTTDESKNIFLNSADRQAKVHQKFCIANRIQRPTLHTSINGIQEIKSAYKTNISKQLQSDDNNNSHQVESKQNRALKKCQHIPYSILLFYLCCCCYWQHIYGFPLVLVKIFKYLKDATVNVLTRQLKIAAAATTTTTSAIATSMCYNDGNMKAACDGKLNKSRKAADYYKANQQKICKRHTTHPRTPYSSCCCSTTTLLTASSSCCKCLKNLILIRKQPQQPRTPYCCCCCRQEYHHHQHHHQHLHQHLHQRTHHHYYQCNRQKQLKQQRQQQQHQHQHQQPQQYKFIATIHLQLPSLLAFSRTLIILMLLSSLWHTSEGFHGSGVKLSTNTVRTKYGLVRGIVVRSTPSLVEAYLGIPYASPPVGSLRFMPPITPSTWKNTRNADRFSPVCPQNVPIPPNGPEALLEVPRARLAQLRRLLPLLSNQSEDCLYLNIYVPIEKRRHRRFTTTSSGELTDTPKLPAILFIHGESYEWNSGNPYDGSELAAHGNIIVVTINFRLGILGFLKTGGKESAQGNFGLMDLVAGLHWLKENLPAFGGDPQQITLLGHGTGAALANILVVSPVASDLVQHTVMVSGSALSPWAIQKNPLFVKRRVAEQTGCHGDMLYYDLAPCLRTKTVTELLAVKIDYPRFLVGFAPFVDGTVISPSTHSIAKLSLPLGSAIVSTSGIEFANFPKRNLIFCLTSVESHLDLNAQDLEFGFNETRRDRILRTYVRNNFHYHLNEIFAVLKNEYTDWDKAIRSPLSSRDATLQFLSDGHTASSLIKLGYMHSLRGGKGYFLHFKHRTVEEEYPQRTGSVRGEDVPFWLGLPISPLFPHNYTTQEKQISRLMLRYLANFAKTGNPNRSSLSSPPPSPSSLIASPSSSAASSSSSSSSRSVDESSEKIKRSSFNIANATSSTSSGPIKSSKNIIEDVATAAAREALNLAVLYNQRRTKRTYYKRHSRSDDDHSGSASNEANYLISTNNNNNNNNNNDNDNKLDGDELPFWDAYDVVNQLYMELGNKAEIQSHYRGHKLSMWLNLIPQLHRHANMNDQSMRHHQFQDDLNNLNLYEGIVRAQIQTKPDDDDEMLLLPKGRLTTSPPAQETNATQKPQGATTECGVDGAMFVAELTTLAPADNRSLVLDSREKEMATASTGLIGNLEVLRRLSGKQFQSYTTALVATVAVGCFLLILNILIFAGIYHQREKRARDAKTKEELQDNDTSKNSSMLKLNAMGSETGSFNDSGAGVSGKATVVFGEYSCYDEKSLQTKDQKLIVELPPAKMVDANWAGCSTSTLDLLKTKHHTPLDTSYTLSNVVPINIEPQTEALMAVSNLEMVTYNPLPMASGVIIDPSFAATSSLSSGVLSKRGSFVGSSGQLNQYDFASVQSSDQMSFKDIENAVKASAAMSDAITQDDDIPEPPPPPRSFQSMQQQQQQQQLLQQSNAAATTSASGGGGILRQAGATSTTQTGGGKKRVHIQEISV